MRCRLLRMYYTFMRPLAVANREFGEDTNIFFLSYKGKPFQNIGNLLLN